MRKLIFLFFSTIVFGQPIPKDSVSYAYFYKKELQSIVQLKKQLFSRKFNALKQIEIAELYAKINCEDSAYATYYKVFEQEIQKKTLKDEQFKDLLYQLHLTESSKHNYSKDRRFFLKQLKTAAKNDSTDKWLAKIELEQFKDLYIDNLNYNAAFEKIKTIQETNFYKTNPEFQATILLNLGSFYTSQEKYDLAEKTLNSCLQVARKNKDYSRQIKALINLGVNEKVRGNLPKAITYLNQTDAIPIEKYRIKISRIIAKQKQLVYEGLKDTIASKQQENLFLKLDSLINDFAKNSNFYEIDVKFQTKEKDEKINRLNDLESRFVRNKTLYGIMILLVFLLALYSFVRWKKSDANKKKIILEKQKVELEKQLIEAEHFTIVEELKNVKQLVIEGYLILKNNKKIYLTELEYIKSVDHYLEVFTKTKKEVVRGTISEILAQLPPNFAQSHRSFLINKNYIKTTNTSEIILKNNTIIPLTRKYKANF
jgi:hypothetical protein